MGCKEEVTMAAKKELDTIVGTTGSKVHIPSMFNKNEKDRLVWREGVLKGRGYDIKMTPQKSSAMPIYVKTRGDMEKVLLDFPKIHFKLTRLK
jgi:hypothetical protein